MKPRFLLYPAVTLSAAERRARVFRIRLLALLPVSVAAVLNTGYLYLSAVAADPGQAADDPRGRLARVLGASFESPGWYDLLAAGLAHFLPVLLLALLTGGIWEQIIAAGRKRRFETGFVATALLFSLLMPPAAAPGHVVFGMSFAILLGKGIFGGEGRTFLSPALLGVALVQVSFSEPQTISPLWSGLKGYAGSDSVALYLRGGEDALAAADIDWPAMLLGNLPGPMGTTSLLAIGLGAALLIAARLISWRLLAAQAIGAAIAVMLAGMAGDGSAIGVMPLAWQLALGSFAFGAVFLACDPVASCCTNPGRWIQGLLIGGLVIAIRVLHPGHPDAVVPALLLASIVAPLIDQAVIRIDVLRRARRHV